MQFVALKALCSQISEERCCFRIKNGRIFGKQDRNYSSLEGVVKW